MIVNTTLPLAIVAGIACHLLYFHRGEKFLYPWRYVFTFVAACLLICASLVRTFGLGVTSALWQTCEIGGSFLLGLYGSLTIYRLFLNPLNKFPGPYLARLTKFDIAWRQRGTSRLHHYLKDAHRRWGPFVRIGPNDLSVTDPACIQAVSSAQSRCYKSEFYAVDAPHESLHVTRDPSLHAKRRRIWSPAFGDRALRGYEHRIQKYIDRLLEQLDAFSGQPVDVSSWFNFYSFDVMGDLGFGRSFNMLESKETHWAIKVMADGAAFAAFAFPAWFLRLLRAIPSKRSTLSRKFFTDQLNERMQQQGKSEDRDIMAYLLDEYYNSDEAQKAKLNRILPLESRLIIIAGSDTTAATLTHLFYHIASQPGLIQRLRDEVEGAVDESGRYTNQKLQHAKLLNACIDETLRLNPPVPSGAPRTTPKEGLVVSDTFIPAATNVQNPWYAMGHDEKLFEKAEQFIPERFTTHPEMIKHKDAWGPFGVGPYSCIGKNLAYMEIRVLAATLIQRYDVAFAPGEDGSALLNDTKDQFTLHMAPLYLIFAKRKT